MACDPTTLALAAKCFACLNPDELDAVFTNLLCQRANASTATTILTNLLAYWKLDEAAGQRQDSVNGFHLTSQGGAATVGVIGNGYQGIPAFGDLIRLGSADTPFAFHNIPFTVTAWIKQHTKGAANKQLVSCANVAGNSGWAVQYIVATDHYAFAILPGGTVVSTVSPTVDVWDFVACWNDGTTSFIQINNGAITSGNLGSPPQAQHDLVMPGSEDAAADAYIDEVGVWQRTLTATERTLLYNSGVGKTYPFT